MEAESSSAPSAESASGPGWLQRLMRRLWWLHSAWALSFGIGMMLFARRGLAYADEVLVVLAASWLIVFIAFRFIVGAHNRRTEEKIARKGLRVVTNYVIKQLYQQMFFFLVPLYASSATWSVTSPNWWLVPILLACAVVSTLDLVFDNFIMERRVIASAMYGFCMFGVLNLVLPLVFRFRHFEALMVAALATAPTIALLSFRLSSVFSVRGIALTVFVTGMLAAGAWYGRVAIPPAPMVLAAGGIGHGEPGQYECVPGRKRTMHANQLQKLRCVTEVIELGGWNDTIVHHWRHDGRSIARVTPLAMPECGVDVLISYPPRLPADPTGTWTCTAETEDGQLVGRIKVKVTGTPQL